MAHYSKLVLDSEWYGTNLGLMLYYAGYNHKRKQFCAKAGISMQTLAQMLHNNFVSIPTFRKVMKALNCTEPGNIVHNYYDRYRNRPITLKEARKVRLLTQAELGKAVGKPQPYIANLEMDVDLLTASMHERLAEVLNADECGEYKFWLR